MSEVNPFEPWRPRHDRGQRPADEDAPAWRAPRDPEAFTAQSAERRECAQDFWRRRDEIGKAERNWVRLTVEQEVALADQERGRDPQAALARLRQTKSSLSMTEHYGAFASQLT